MSTPSGPLLWGQSGRYSGWHDRTVITALGGRRTGIVAPVRMAAAAGLAITLDVGWLAVAPCGDGTTAVITSPIPISVPVAPGGDEDRTDELAAEIANPDTALWTVAVRPEGASASGLVLGWLDVPAGATSAAEMGLRPRQQDFSTGGAIPGPIGPPGPQGPPGSATLIVGTFRNRTPDELPADGFIEAGWDGPGNPANDVQVEIGWSVIYAPDGTMWTYVTELGIGGPWLSPGVVQGPPGERGPEGPAGPAGPAGSSPPFWPAETDQRDIPGGPFGSFQDLSRRYTVPANTVRVGSRLRLTAWGTGTWPTAASAFGFRGNVTGNVGLGAILFAPAVFSNAAQFHWQVAQDVIFGAVGTGGTFKATIRPVLSLATGNLNPSVPGQASMTGTRRGANVVNTAAAWQFWLEYQWAENVAGRNLSIDGSHLEFVAGWPGQEALP